MGESSPIVARDAPPTPLADRSLRRATTQDAQRLKTVLADAFFEDPVLGWLMPEDTNRLVRLRRYFGIELRHLALARASASFTTMPEGSEYSHLT